MLILLPPSEGKSAPEDGPTLDLAALAFPALAHPRRAVLSALVTLCRGDVSDAAATLGLGVTQRGEVRANTRLKRDPCAPAIDVYTGVLYENLDAATLSPRARARLDEHVAIASALWGLLRPTDPIPAYRLSGGVSLPGIGPLGNAWREPVGRVLAGTEGLVVDLRSSAYVNLAPLPADVIPRAASIRVLTEKAGKRTVVSHSNKATKGLVVRALLQGRRTPTDATGLADAIDAAGFRVEHSPARRGQAHLLDVVID